MSSDTRSRLVDIDTARPIGPTLPRLLALGSVGALTGAYVHVLYDITRVVGGTEALLALVGTVVVVATVFSRVIRPRTAAIGAAVAAGTGFAYYLSMAGTEIETLRSAGGGLLADTITLATGLPLIRVISADSWVLGFVPAPVFLSWYLALRGRYAASVVPGSLALFFLVLTGDAGTATTLFGVLAAIGAVGFGELERRGNAIAQADLLVVLFSVIVVLSLSVTVVPSGPTTPAVGEQSQSGTLEGSIDYAGDRSGISGSVDLSPEVRFVVESDQPSYWRTGIYDRFTGDEWVRTGQSSAYEGELAAPPGRHDRVEQRVTAEVPLGVMPAASEPIAAERRAGGEIEVSSHGQLQPDSTIAAGETYVVESAIVDPDPAELQTAGTDYPDYIDTYQQTPAHTSAAFETYTAEVTADADTPYEKAVEIEHYLRTQKEYSLDVDKPDGNVAEEFLFEMDAGYCVYFATTMTQMLRAEDVPARYVTGYTSGEQIDDETHVVRGLDAHAWVEVYFPDVGWVAFEPTPADAREDVHDDRLEEARATDTANVEPSQPITDEPDERDGDDQDEADSPTENETDTDDPVADNETDPLENESTDRDDDTVDPQPEDDTDGTDDGLPSIPITRELVALGLVVLAGVVAGAHRSRPQDWLRRRAGIYWQRRRDDPDEAVCVAMGRLERLYGRSHRPRRRSESHRQYLHTLTTEQAIDPRVMTVVTAYERASYGDGVDSETAAEVVAIADELARDRLPVIGSQRE